MNAMSTPYLESGRARQKQRTRDALVEAARRLIEDGDIPRVEDVAEASGISRTTAYRYFPTQAMLLAAAFPETTRTSLLSDPAPAAVEDRVGVVLDAFIDIIERTEVQQRAMLRLSLGEQPHELPLRQGRAIGWMTEALEPLLPSLGVDGVRRLAVALRSVSGIETRVWLADVAGLDVGEIRELQTWMVQALVATAAAGMPANSAEPS